jgi:hypothetical protein
MDTRKITYRNAATRGTRASDILHIAEVALGQKWLETRHGTALCGVYVQGFPESGERGDPANATCRPCIRKYSGLGA